ncbi:hypothetical protein Cthe_0705 [Acetivibrio thermocellus ATCC 27405]|jgi:hypothetical protein|uniref:DUF4264 domain-containing protein n=2 Tax=Acetivibrio thermocellus TaxID=1515 RepID=A3DDB1_ACET2|nr:hypothetical protein Cthe_0705 [Acetivibrio thermocellus ATCC 27405]
MQELDFYTAKLYIKIKKHLRRINMDLDDKLELKATVEVSANLELYKVVDFLNKNLKDKKLIFGLSKKDNKMIISIYET